MNPLPLFSILIPTRNRAHLLPRAVESLFAQTYSHYEIIIANDGSEDDTAQILLMLQQQALEKNIRLAFRNLSHTGIAGALNHCLSMAKGDIIASLGDDDCYAPTALQQIVECFVKHPHLTLIYTDFLDTFDWVNFTRGFTKDFDYGTEKIENYIGHLVAVRGEVLKASSGYDTRLKTYEDWDMWLRLTRHCRAYHLAEPLYYCFQHSKRITFTPAMEEGHQRVLERLQKDYYAHRNCRVGHVLRLARRTVHRDWLVYQAFVKALLNLESYDNITDLDKKAAKLQELLWQQQDDRTFVHSLHARTVKKMPLLWRTILRRVDEHNFVQARIIRCIQRTEARELIRKYFSRLLKS